MVIRWPKGVPESEFSVPFAQGMVDRMGVSYFKYGRVAEAYPSRVDAIASLKKRLDRYDQDGNTEWLMDVANFAMIEFMHPRHPSAHFRSTDSDESPGRVWNNGAVADAAKRRRARTSDWGVRTCRHPAGSIGERGTDWGY